MTIWHTDGDITLLLDKVIESGISAIQCIDPLANMDIVKTKKKLYGRTAIIGNIDCSILQRGTHEEIDAECKRIIEACKGDGGFIFGGCNAIFKGIPAKNYQVMVDARYKYGIE